MLMKYKNEELSEIFKGYAPRALASASPAGPPPTTTTSQSSCRAVLVLESEKYL